MVAMLPKNKPDIASKITALLLPSTKPKPAYIAPATAKTTPLWTATVALGNMSDKLSNTLLKLVLLIKHVHTITKMMSQ